MARTRGKFAIPCLTAALALVLAISGCGALGAAPVSEQSPGDPLAEATFDTHPGPPNAVLTQRGDATRLGWNSAETSLTVAAVASGHFGKRVAYPVDGKIYAQPLYVPNFVVGGRAHDIVVVATEHDTLYAFDANVTDASTPPLWKTSLLRPGARPFNAAVDRIAANRLCDSITPEVGITSTPVIDWPTKTLYAMALDVEQATMTYRVHKLDLATGAQSVPSTVVSAEVAGTGIDQANGKIAFVASDEQQRMGLTLVNGVVYAGFASWCGLNPYHGWVLGYRTGDLTRKVVYNSSPNDYAGGLWESQSGITVDEHGHLLLVTGNGRFNLDTGGADAGDSMLEMVPRDGSLHVVDSFTPFDQQCRAQHDQDLGSGSPLEIPGHNELVLSSKTGSVYVLDRDHLGGYTPLADACRHRDRTDVDKIKQELAVGTVPGGMWGTWGYWKAPDVEYVYGSGAEGRPTQWRLASNGTIVATPVAQGPEAFTYPGAVPVVSSNGSTTGTGIVWTVDGDTGATLRAFDAANIGHEIWNSSRDGLDDTGGFNHFVVPTVADGRVFVGDQSHLEIYGLLAS